MNKVKLMQGDNIESLKKLPENSIDSIVTDPPYGLSFMCKKWDYDVPSVEFWKEVLRVLKPGGHVLSFGGTRTYHRMVVNIEDAGFEIRDQIMWLYGSGFPKSHNIGKSVDKLNGVEGDKGPLKRGGEALTYDSSEYGDIGWKADKRDPNTYIAKNDWSGWGTALKPANEPICVARKPLSEKTIAENVIKWGTGGINIDGCRIGTDELKPGKTNGFIDSSNIYGGGKSQEYKPNEEGRFPANIILDEEAGKVLDEQTGNIKSTKFITKDSDKPLYGGNSLINSKTKDNTERGYNDKGGASRFFYCPKVGKKERNAGCDELEEKENNSIDSTYAGNQTTSKIGGNPDKPTEPKKNNHPTVKPINLMTYLCRLVTPVGGIVLDPFMGSGSTGIAARLKGFRFCGMEMDADYFKISESRIENFEKYREFIK